jgi:bifunctional UDP-N-acetylglucosamine pyrophosphorylase/glucosamine-1-phosphate N-acetyltransferase
VLRIVEARDASPDELAVSACYAGMLAAPRARLFAWLHRVGNNHVKGEYYLTDLVGLAVARGLQARVAMAAEAR